MPTITQIVTHPGGAHKDDFLACSLLAFRHRVPIARREPTSEDIKDPAICVVDIGGSDDAALSNFDHHQYPRNHPPVCALSLVLQNLGLYEDAQQFCDWLETTERIDTRGPNETSRWLGIQRHTMQQLTSPIDIAMIRRFSLQESLTPDDALWHVMAMIGEDLYSYLTTLRERMKHIGEHSEFWTVDGPHGDFEVLFMPRTDPLPAEPSMGIPRYIDTHDLTGEVIAMVYPDRRGDGYGLSRYNDDQRLDFSRLSGLSDIGFAHARGFIAKTSATDPARLRELLCKAQIKR